MAVDPKTLTDERHKTHGHWPTQAQCVQDLKGIVSEREGWNRLASGQKEAIEMVLMKVSRIVNGDPNVVDHWDDIAGYAHLGGNCCGSKVFVPACRLCGTLEMQLHKAGCEYTGKFHDMTTEVKHSSPTCNDCGVPPGTQHLRGCICNAR